MANNYIRSQAKLANIKLWEIADELNISDTKFSKMLRKELSNNVLTEQEYVVESGKTVAQYLKEINATELEMIRYEVGEGIEKVEVDFASEVAAQMKK